MVWQRLIGIVSCSRFFQEVAPRMMNIFCSLERWLIWFMTVDWLVRWVWSRSWHWRLASWAWFPDRWNRAASFEISILVLGSSIFESVRRSAHGLWLWWCLTSDSIWSPGFFQEFSGLRHFVFFTRIFAISEEHRNFSQQPLWAECWWVWFSWV